MIDIKQVSISLDSITDAFGNMTEKSQNLLKDYFKKIHEAMCDEFQRHIEENLKYDIEDAIRYSVEHNMLALLAGDMESVKHLGVISEYNWDNINKVRIKIWKQCSSEIEKSIIKELKENNESLEDRIQELESERWLR